MDSPPSAPNPKDVVSSIRARSIPRTAAATGPIADMGTLRGVRGGCEVERSCMAERAYRNSTAQTPRDFTDSSVIHVSNGTFRTCLWLACLWRGLVWFLGPDSG